MSKNVAKGVPGVLKSNAKRSLHFYILYIGNSSTCRSATNTAVADITLALQFITKAYKCLWERITLLSVIVELHMCRHFHVTAHFHCTRLKS